MKNIAVLMGDGVSGEILSSAIKVLDKISLLYNMSFKYDYVPIGGRAYDETGLPLPNKTVEVCLKSDAVLLGAVGDWKYDNLAPELRPEKALLGIRKKLNLFANLRPVRLYPGLAHSCPLKDSRIGSGIDILVMRELTGGLYFGQPKKTEEYVEVEEDGTKGKRTLLRATDTMVIDTEEIERIAHVGFKAARLRHKKLASIDKANVLENGILWREVVTEVAKMYPDVQLTHVFVDNAAMQLILNPSQFDVILCENMFGDILSDEAAALAGSLGLLPSASLGETSGQSGFTFGLYEPAGGSAPDIAGKNIANPLAQILSAAMMLRYSFKEEAAAKAIDSAVEKVISAGWRTGDICCEEDPRDKVIGTSQMGDAVVAALE